MSEVLFTSLHLNEDEQIWKLRAKSSCGSSLQAKEQQLPVRTMSLRLSMSMLFFYRRILSCRCCTTPLPVTTQLTR